MKRILVAAGNSELKSLLCATFEEAGYEVHSASGAHEAVLLASAYRPRAVLLTATLEDGDGYRACRTIKTRHWQGQRYDPPKVLLLADHKIEHDPDIEDMFRAFSKADAVLDTPFDPPALVSRIVAAIGHADPSWPPRTKRSVLAGRIA